MIRWIILVLFVMLIVKVVDDGGIFFTVDVNGSPTKYGLKIGNSNEAKKP